MPKFRPGDYVKAEFQDEASGERIWVVVDSCDDGAGVLFAGLTTSRCWAPPPRWRRARCGLRRSHRAQEGIGLPEAVRSGRPPARLRWIERKMGRFVPRLIRLQRT